MTDLSLDAIRQRDARVRMTGLNNTHTELVMDRRRLLAEVERLQNADSRSRQLLSIYGVPEERQRSLSNGIEVLMSRVGKEVRSLESSLTAAQAEIEGLRKDVGRLDKLAGMAARGKVTIADTGVIPYRFCLNGQVLGNSFREVIDKAIADASLTSQENQR